MKRNQFEPHKVLQVLNNPFGLESSKWGNAGSNTCPFDQGEIRDKIECKFSHSRSVDISRSEMIMHVPEPMTLAPAEMYWHPGQKFETSLRESYGINRVRLASIRISESNPCDTCQNEY